MYTNLLKVSIIESVVGNVTNQYDCYTDLQQMLKVLACTYVWNVTLGVKGILVELINAMLL